MNAHLSAPPELEPAEMTSRPVPAVVIGVGAFAARAARQAQHIYLRGDARRQHATDFYRLQPYDSTGMNLVTLDSPVDEEVETKSDSYLELRQAALRLAVQHSVTLKARLERLLHEQRVHERLIEAGWAEQYDVPLNFFILADINDPWAAGMLLPLGAIMNELIANTSLCQAHWLLGTAVFPDSAVDQDLAVWSTLQNWDDFLRPESESRDELGKALKLQYRQAPDFAVYLFDSRKEGTAMVKDPAGLNTLMGNALLALLQRDLARRFFQERDEDALFERGAYYSSIGAAGLVYDPESLQAACARRVGHAFLREKILCTDWDGQAAIQFSHQLSEKLGSAYAWLERLTGQLPPAVGQLRIQPDTLEMTALLTDLVLVGLDYERVQATPWGEQIQRYQDRFKQQTLPDVTARLASSREQFEIRQAEILKVALERLPLDAGLYPGGLHNARRALELIREALNKQVQQFERLATTVQERQAAVRQKLAAQLQEMQTLLAGAPALPWWLRILPAFARQWLAPLYLVRRYGRKLYLAQSLRDECQELLQQHCGLQVEQQAIVQASQMLPALLAQVQEAQEALIVLEEKFKQVIQFFSPEWDEFPLAAAENGWDSLFRQPIADQALAAWAYTLWQPDLDAWVHTFLGARPLFADWHSVEVDALTSWIQEHSLQAYQPVWSLDLEAIFGLWAANALVTKTNGSQSEKPLSSKTILACMNAAFPPVRPDFDAVGGSSGSSVTFHGLTGYPEWQYCCLPQAQNRTTRWQAVLTGDPHTALFIQVQRNIPLRSLSASFQTAWSQMANLAPDLRRDYDLLAGLDSSSPPILENVDPNSPDLVHKTFSWKFKPKGSNKEIEQTIEMALSRSRFEYYRRQPRFNGQWNLYAELEMPEVRDLAAEFQKLHARHKWSTFNQAYNVLKFVQSCIPYSYDKDTTGHEDWARYPIETLMEGTGDCEDVAILCATVIARLGCQVVLLLYPPVAEFKTHHLAFGVAGADKLKGDYVKDTITGHLYFYGEATANGWHLGEIPPNYTNVVPIKMISVSILIE